MTDSRNTRTSIIVVAFHGKRWIPGCVASIDETMERREHLYLVDNSGNDGCLPDAMRNCELTIPVTPRPMGFAEANNFALERIDTRLPCICFLNQDTLCRPGWLERCVELLDSEPQIGAVTPVLYQFGWEALNPNFLACARRNPQLAKDLSRQCRAADRDAFYAVPDIPAAAMVVRSDVLRQTGPFDPIFGSYYEDFDLCLRIRQAGFDVGVCGAAEVAHYDSVTDEDPADPRTRRRHRLILRNRAILNVRQTSGSRTGALLRSLLQEYPRQLARTLLRRPGRKAARSILSAAGSLIRLAPRLVSRSRDDAAREAAFQAFRERFRTEPDRAYSATGS